MKDRDVFINCPFSEDYRETFWAIIFAVTRSGFTPRCARETDDGAEVRIDKICRIIADCRYGVHDISKTEPDTRTGLPRFNMPFELGLFLGARKYGARQSRKKALILDRELYRFQQFLSDIAGQDIHAHGDEVDQVIREVSNWLRDEARVSDVPGGHAIAVEFADFRGALPAVAAANRLQVDELTFKDLAAIAATWIVENNVVT